MFGTLRSMAREREQLTNEVHIEAPLYRLHFKLNSLNYQLASVLAIATKHIGHREPVPEEVMIVICELFQVERNAIANPTM